MAKAAVSCGDPVELAARRRALELLDAAERQAARLRKRASAPSSSASDGEPSGKPDGNPANNQAPADDEALHDFRVALRRLRSHLGAYRPYLDRHLGGKFRKRLRRLMDQTSRDRDAEVHRAWVAARLGRRNLPQLERRGLERLAAELIPPTTTHGAYLDLLDAFTRTAGKIRTRLQRGRHAIELDADGQPRSFAAATAELAQAFAADLFEQLAAVTSPADEPAAHEARLTAKKLRYLLEPLRSEVREARPLVTELRKLQDLLGEMHDLHTLEARVLRQLEKATCEWRRTLEQRARERQPLSALRAANPELLDCYAAAAVLRRLEQENAALYRKLDGAWHGAAADRFFARLDGFARVLEQRPAAG